LAPRKEPAYLVVCPAPLADIAVLLLDTGLRLGEALSLEWPREAGSGPGREVRLFDSALRERRESEVPQCSLRRARGPNVEEMEAHRDRARIPPGRRTKPKSPLDDQEARVGKLLSGPADFVLTFVTACLL